MKPTSRRPIRMRCGAAACWLWFGVLICSHLCLPVSPAAGRDTSASEPSFESDIHPLFRAKCLRCHGEKGRKGELDLRTLAGVLKGGESGAVVVPGDPEKSLLYEKVREGMM